MLVWSAALLGGVAACDGDETESIAAGGSGGGGGGGSNPACPHGVCFVGAALSAADCGSCVAAVCAAAPGCCQDLWTPECVEQAKALCTPLTCPLTSCDPAYPSAPGGEPCPEVCTSCMGPECNILCSGEGACDGQTIECPTGFDCKVVCSGLESCLGSTLICPPSARCRVICAGSSACAGAAVQCDLGPCELGCDYTGATQTCGQTALSCGLEQCTASCTGPVDDGPQQTCDGACDCANNCD